VIGKYGGEHQALRRAAKPFAYGQPCVRCGQPMRPGQPIDLDHADDGAGWLGFAHSHCNRSAGGRVGRARQLAARRTTTVFDEMALGIEISQDRSHTAIVAAGALEDGDTLAVDLLHYLPGTVGVVAAVVAVAGPVAVVIDPHSPSATLVQPLADAGVTVATPSSGDVAVAYGTFLDELAAGRLRHTGRAELTEAVRAAGTRPMGGAATWQRRGTEADVSPLVAASLALWGWQHRPPPSPAPWVAWGDSGARTVDRGTAAAVVGVAPGLGWNPRPPPAPDRPGLPGHQRL
jgi:hypothetical protein